MALINPCSGCAMHTVLLKDAWTQVRAIFKRTNFYSRFEGDKYIKRERTEANVTEVTWLTISRTYNQVLFI